MKKGDNGKKRRRTAEEIFFRFSLTEEFQQDLRGIRKAVGLPENGFTKLSEKTNWINSNNGKPLLGIFVNKLFTLAQKYKVIQHWELMEGYIFFGENATYEFEPFPEPSYFIKILPPTHTLKLPNDSDQLEDLYFGGAPYVKVLIFAGGSKSNVVSEIKKEWPRIEEMLRQQGAQIGKRIKSIDAENKKMRKRVLELKKKPIKELQKMVISFAANPEVPPTKNRDLLIADILEHDGFGKINEGYVRGLLYKK